MPRDEWLRTFASALGTSPPSDEELDGLLALAGVAAHASERTAAPVSCWLAARAGVSPAEALDVAQRIARQGGAPEESPREDGASEAATGQGPA
jgi:GTP cyclohydrolase III